MSKLTDYVVFNDDKLAKKYGAEPIPMSVLYEGYFDGDIDIHGDIFELLRNSEQLLKHTITRQHLQWAVTNFVPDMVHTKAQDEKMIRLAYDRGNDFFQWFLGSSMVYTSGLFESESQSLEAAQENHLAHAAKQLQLQKGDRLLDVGCGWGSFLKHCAQHYEIEGTGVTLAEKQAAYARQQLQSAGLSERVLIQKQDYRDITTERKYDKIVCMEMIEHVGMKNLTTFCEQIHELLDDDGLFLLQWTGLRRSLKHEDLMWGLFVNKYIFPGADASLPPSTMLKTLEKAGFEVHAIENISGHYAWTLRAWYANWNKNRQAVLAAYGERWFRIWNFFLAWSILVAEQGNAGCYQAVLNKNVATFRRTRWIDGGKSAQAEARPAQPAEEVPESAARPFGGESARAGATRH